MSRVSGIEFEIVPASWSKISSEFQAGRLDALANVMITEERRGFMDFSITHAYMHGVVYFRSGQPAIQRTADMAGKKIGIISGTVEYSNAVRNKGWGGTISPARGVDELLDAVVRGDSDVALFTRRLSEKTVKARGLKSEYLRDLVFQYHIAVHKGDSATLARLNEALATVRQDGSFERIYDRWIGPIEPHSVQITDLRRYFLPTAVILLAVVFVIGWQRRMLAQRAIQATALREAEERYRGLVESAFDGSVIQQDGNIKAVNASYAGMFGYTIDELLGRPVLDLLAPEVRDKVGPNVRANLTGSYETVGLRKDGTRIIIETAGKACTYHGRPGRIAAVRDITERRASEKTLRLQGAALEAAANAIVIMDRQGTIEWANPAFTKLSGWATTEALGKNPRDLVKSGEHDAAFYRQMWQTIIAGKVWQGEIVNRRKDGKLRTEDMTITPLCNANGEISHFIAIKQDITEQKMMETQFLQGQRMEAIGALAGGIAHDLNNILSPIMMLTGLLKDKLTDKGDLEILAMAHTSAQRGANIIKQLLTYSRGQEGERAPVQPRHLIHEMI